MATKIALDHILFVDIETVSQKEYYSQLNEEEQKYWQKKASYLRSENQSAEDIYPRAGIYAEFGKIICISVGYLYSKNEHIHLRLKSFTNSDEKLLLQEFTDALEKFSKNRIVYLCGHNGKEFDFPYIARRLLVNHLPLPKQLQVSGMKPWEVPFLDTLEMWKFGDYKHYTSLSLLCHILQIPTPKNDIDGSQVYEVYYKENDVERIARYCEQDVLALCRLYLHLDCNLSIPDTRVQFSVTKSVN